MAGKYVLINDIIAEHNARMQNLKKYYPFFVLNETTFSQYKDGKYNFLDMGYITLASLRFLIHENNFHEKDITFEEYEQFLTELLERDFDLSETEEERHQLILYEFRHFHQREERGEESRSRKRGYIYSGNRIHFVGIDSQRNK